MQALIDRIVEDSEYLEARGGVYVVWQAGDGPELWLQLDPEDRLIGISPHFAGPTRMRLGIVAPIERPGQSELDGSFYAWVNPGADGPASGDYPLVFDCPDAAMHDDLELPCVMPVQLAGFAHHLEVWADADTYDREQTEPKFASQSFVPAGLFRGDEDEPGPPVAYAMFTGHVAAAEERHNPLTSTPYWYAAVVTLGGDDRRGDRKRAGRAAAGGRERGVGRVLALGTGRLGRRVAVRGQGR
jgi:hypothetical protein